MNDSSKLYIYDSDKKKLANYNFTTNFGSDQK